MRRNRKDFLKLRAELDNDPKTRGYSGMSNIEVVTDIMTKYSTKVSPVTMNQLREWAALNERALKINTAITGGSTNQVKNVALVVDKLLGNSDGFLDPDNSAHLGWINTLVADGIISSGDRAALAAKATTNITRAEKLGLGQVKEGHVLVARSI